MSRAVSPPAGSGDPDGRRPDGSVVVVGSVNTDYVLRVARRPDGGETVADAELELHPGGKGANQAVAAARSGASVHLVARVGDDAAGQARLAQLRAHGVEVDHVRPTPGAPTGTAVILLTPDGENSIVVAPGANGRLSPADLDDAGALISSASVLLAQLEVGLDAVRRAVQLAPAGALVVLNAAPYRDLPPELLRHVDVLVVNQSEAAALSGQPVRDETGARAVLPELRRLGPAAVVVTLGADGALASSSQGEELVPAPPTEVVDTTGAGDAFVGGLAAVLAAGRPLAEAVRVGVRLGSATVAHLGATPYLPPELVGIARLASADAPPPNAGGGERPQPTT